ncbi:glycoside hydrolase family 15 protein [Nocardioides gansuensis]|uniref:Glycoside hydrolase family 15 protein n=1 Tax=Nocardioides gansuensis TaxID=2138300 RepID=A0A2T8F6X8_9ACTN|nr:glycoside hydrolase family 15 protein [Nocardioides gansuensis]PVG81466.1 glycoside hydrolase family 15 protein [Nocardioides gansuensis]
MPSPAPIEDYGLLGDTRTAALVSSDGSVDWMCIPRFDGPPVFGRLVGGRAAGSFRLGPAVPADVVSRHYRRDTATLETTWKTDAGRLTLTEGMVTEVRGQLMPATMLVRRLSAPDGPVDATVMFDPRLGDRHRRPRIQHRGDVLVCSWPTLAIALQTTPVTSIEPGVPMRITTTPDRPFLSAMSVADREPLVYVDPDAARRALNRDELRWQAWCRDIAPGLPHRGAVVRSLLTLRLLTYSPSGAPVAAPTTSLPEEPCGVRNWDYRYAWPRDASIGIGAFLGVGKQDEARAFMAWLLSATRLDRPRLPVLFTLHGKHPPPERELKDWPGYAGSAPVRRGNAASGQHQLDGYGWVLDAAWLLTRAGHHLYSETWRTMSGFADRVAESWREPDAGIWEVRADAAHHVHSKLMAWLALDRALRIAPHHHTRASRTRRWDAERAALHEEITRCGFSTERRMYTRSYGSPDTDAALLVLPQLDFEPSDSPRVRHTIDAIVRNLDAGRPLLYRYPPGTDGLPGNEGAFLPCSFWLVQALARTGRLVEATGLFEEILALASPLGLFAEEMDPSTHHHLGNYPQALTHAAVVQAALAIRDATDGLPGTSLDCTTKFGWAQ